MLSAFHSGCECWCSTLKYAVYSKSMSTSERSQQRRTSNISHPLKINGSSSTLEFGLMNTKTVLTESSRKLWPWNFISLLYESWKYLPTLHLV